MAHRFGRTLYCVIPRSQQAVAKASLKSVQLLLSSEKWSWAGCRVGLRWSDKTSELWRSSSARLLTYWSARRCSTRWSRNTRWRPVDDWGRRSWGCDASTTWTRPSTNRSPPTSSSSCRTASERSGSSPARCFSPPPLSPPLVSKLSRTDVLDSGGWGE